MTTEIPKTWENKSRANVTAKIPYAYKVSEEDPLVLVPDPEVVPIVEEAMDYLDQGHSYRNVAGWLTEKADRKISHQGIANIWKHHRGHRKSPKMKKLKEQAKKTKPRTKEEEEEQKARYKLRGAKRSQTVQERKLKKLQTESNEGASAPPGGGDGDSGSDLPDETQDANIIFQPNPGPQTDFLAAPEREVLYGGAAGGGKSYALLADPMRYFGYGAFNGLILRRTNDELRELIWKSQELYPQAYPGAKWQEKKSQWTFPSGARLWMTYLERDEDVLRYQGQAFCVAEGTPVKMADGSCKPVETLSEGDVVETLEGPKPLEWVSQRLRKPCVKVSVYDAEGHLLGEQLQPYTHPIALLSSKPYSKLSDLSRNVEQFRSSQLQWLSAEHLESLAEESPEIFSSPKGGQSDCIEFEDEHPSSQPLGGYFYPAVLHGLPAQSGSFREATQCRTCGRSLKPLSEKYQESLEFSLASLQPYELDLLYRDRSKLPCHPSDDDETCVLPSTQTTQGYQYDCLFCLGLCDGQLLQEKESGSNDVPSPDDAEGLAHDDLRGGERGCTLSHNHYRCTTYSHPYTQEQRPLTAAASVGIVQVTPLTNTPYKNVIDLTVKSSNHYITSTGVVNQNCYIAFDELTQHPTPFAWNYMRSRLRTTDPELPIFMRATSNPGGPGHCLTHGDVLTPDRGWVDITEMRTGDPIYSVAEDGSLFETVVDHTYKQWVEEDIVQVKARGLRMSITKDHKVAKVGGTRNSAGKAYSLVPFSDLPGQATILRSAKFNGNDIEFVKIEDSGGRKRRLQQPHLIHVKDYAALVGWYVSEGCRVERDKAICIAQSKPEGRRSIAALLDRIGFSYSTSETCFYIYCPSLYAHMERYGDGSTQKRLTREFKNLPVPALESFFQAAMEGDGCDSYYYTISEQLKDDFSEVAFKTGRLVYISQRKRENRDHISYEISTKKTKSGGTEILTGNHVYNVDTETQRSSDIEYVPYKGYVYCVGIPETHSFIARQDGSVWVSGNTWVKKMFIDPAPPNTSFPARDIDSEEVLRYPDSHEKAGQALFNRRFIPATLKDNPYLFEGGQYEANLLSLPEMQRRQLLEGDWNLAEGAAFPEFKTSIHTCEPFDIPDDWRRFRSCDYGYSSYSAVHWFAIDPNYETLYCYREMYVSKHTGRDLGAAVMEAERGENIQYGVLDSSCWHQRGQLGPSIAEEMISMGCKWRPSDRTNGARVAGKNRLHELLKIDDRIALPGIIFFNNCRQIISDLPVIPTDPKGTDDIDPRYASDHAYDSVRYAVMSRPRAASPFEEFGKYAPARGWRPADSSFGY